MAGSTHERVGKQLAVESMPTIQLPISAVVAGSTHVQVDKQLAVESIPTIQPPISAVVVSSTHGNASFSSHNQIIRIQPQWLQNGLKKSS